MFVTGVTTDEVLAFGRWLGRGNKLLNASEWRVCREWFAKHAAPSPPADLIARLSRDALAIWDLIEGEWWEESDQINLQELSLMRQGILEWVVDLPGTYYALGDPRAAKSLRTVYDPVRPFEEERTGLGNLGFRLATR